MRFDNTLSISLLKQIKIYLSFTCLGLELSKGSSSKISGWDNDDSSSLAGLKVVRLKAFGVPIISRCSTSLIGRIPFEKLSSYRHCLY